MTARTPDKKAFSILFLILCGALILRCIFLARQSLWLDEFVSWTCSARDFWGALYCDINKPPLYYPLLHFWRDAFGSSETALRALSIPPGLVSVWLMYLLGARLFSRPIGYLAAGYQAVAAFQIYFAQEARNYTWLEFFLLLAGLFLWNALGTDSRKERWRYWTAYTVSITLALYTHYFAVFFIAGHGLYVLCRRRQQLLAATVSVAIAIALIAPFAVIFVRTPGAVADQIRHFPFLKVPQAYFAFLFGDSLIPMDDVAVRHLAQTLEANAGIVAVVLGSAAVLCYFLALAWRRWREAMVYAAWHAGVPVAMAFLVSMKKEFFDRRYMISASPYVYLLVAAAVWEVVLNRRNQTEARWKTAAGLAATGVWCVLLAVSLYHYYFTERFGKEQWREAIAYIEAASSADGKDLLILDPDYLQMCYHYYQKRDLPIWPVTPKTEREAINSETLVRDRARGFHKVWLVYSHNLNQDLLAELKRLYPEQGSRDFPLANGIKVYSFQAAGAE